MSYQYRPCNKCGHVNKSPKVGTHQNKAELCKILCKMMGWKDEAFVVQNRSLSQDKLKDLIHRLSATSDRDSPIPLYS